MGARLTPEIRHGSYVFEIGKIALSGESRALAEDPPRRFRAEEFPVASDQFPVSCPQSDAVVHCP
ncbi:MAG: hypothetical protein NTX53_11590 [candidate division WOR-3 bacterium]|nr:hypothetical protein [candidate division WOR-3 bacterium]